MENQIPTTEELVDDMYSNILSTLIPTSELEPKRKYTSTRRNLTAALTQVSPKRMGKIDKKEIEMILESREHCCKSKECIKILISKNILTKETLFKARLEYQQKNEREKKNWLISEMHHYKSPESKHLQLWWKGNKICKTAYLNIHGCSNKKFRSAYASFKQGYRRAQPHGNTLHKDKRRKTIREALGISDNWIQLHGIVLNDKVINSNSLIFVIFKYFYIYS